MKYNVCSTSCSLGLINKHLFKQVFRTYASTGLGLWNENVNTDIKQKVENYWRDKVNSINQNESEPGKEKFYVLSMFPYPSGSLHMGHVRVYTISDSIARFYRMKGKRVIHPMGWDAFGLPAENAAIERNSDPAEWTSQNVSTMREQLNSLGCHFDWDRELSTCDPEYYKWTQELFIKLFERNLAYQKESYVNWDPVDKTVLADEQVDANNRSWRSGAKVEKRLLKQWFIKTTAFAKQLLDGLNDPILKEWKDIIKIQQHWIGECTGTHFDVELISDFQEYPKMLTLWTDKPEFIKDAKFLAISNNSILRVVAGFEKVEGFQKLTAKIVNPFTEEELPVFLTNKIEFSDCRNDHLGIPSASESDAQFCKAVGIPFEPSKVLSSEEQDYKRLEVLNEAKKLNIGGFPVSSKLRDWLISRQRYWGTPIPIVHCESCGACPVPREELPVLLPNLREHSSKRQVSLRESTEWLKTSCPECGKEAVREADTMDTFVDSSWYFMRFIDPQNKKEMFSKEKAKKDLPVDIYVGGKEHAALHLYYARFVNHFLHSEGLVPTREPFKQLLVQGMVKGMSLLSKQSGKYLRPDEVEIIDKKYFEKATNEPVTTLWEKMSKSKYNGVEPSEMFSKYSADTIRLLMLADVAPTSHRNWSDATFPGILNWQHRLWKIVSDFIKCRQELTDEELRIKPEGNEFEKNHDYMFDSRNFYVKGVTYNIVGSQQLSVAISKLQGLTNSIRKVSRLCKARSHEYERALAVQIIMLAPLAPHFASELWAGFCSATHRLSKDREIQWDKDVLEQTWPEIDMNYKLRLHVYVNSFDSTILKFTRQELEKMSADQALKLALQDTKVQKTINDWTVVEVKFLAKPGCDAKMTIITQKAIKEASQESAV